MSENKDNIDSKIQNTFLLKYMNLYNEGKITEEQYNEVGELIENIADYSQKEFINKLKKIFPEDKELQQIQNKKNTDIE